MNAKRREYLESQLSAYLDGELTPRELAEVQAFLDSDADARALLEELQVTSRYVHRLPRAEASDSLMEDLRSRLERKALLEGTRVAGTLPRGVPFWRGRGIAAAAVIALAFVGGYLLWSMNHQVSDEQGHAVRYAFTDRPDRDPGSTGRERLPAVPDDGHDSLARDGKPSRLHEGGRARKVNGYADRADDRGVTKELSDAANTPEVPSLPAGSENAAALPRALAPKASDWDEIRGTDAPVAAMKPVAVDRTAGMEEDTPLMADGISGDDCSSVVALVPGYEEYDGAKDGEFRHVMIQDPDRVVVRLVYADAASRQAAVDELRSRYCFKTVSVSQLGALRFSRTGNRDAVQSDGHSSDALPKTAEQTTARTPALAAEEGIAHSSGYSRSVFGGGESRKGGESDHEIARLALTVPSRQVLDGILSELKSGRKTRALHMNDEASDEKAASAEAEKGGAIESLWAEARHGLAQRMYGYLAERRAEPLKEEVGSSSRPGLSESKEDACEELGRDHDSDDGEPQDSIIDRGSKQKSEHLAQRARAETPSPLAQADLDISTQPARSSRVGSTATSGTVTGTAADSIEGYGASWGVSTQPAAAPVTPFETVAEIASRPAIAGAGLAGVSGTTQPVLRDRIGPSEVAAANVIYLYFEVLPPATRPAPASVMEALPSTQP